MNLAAARASPRARRRAFDELPRSGMDRRGPGGPQRWRVTHLVIGVIGDDWRRQCELIAQARALLGGTGQLTAQLLAGSGPENSVLTQAEGMS